MTIWAVLSFLLLNASLAVRAEPIPGDVNEDGSVDFADFLILAANFGKNGGSPRTPDTIIVVVSDTLVVRDTTTVMVRDTLIQIVHDTLTVTQTIHDTIWVSLSSEDGSGSSGAPGTPPLFSARRAEPNSIALEWTAPSIDADGSPLTGLSGYRLYRAIGSEASGFIVLAQLDVALTTFLDTGLEEAATYFYKVSAVDADGNESELSGLLSLMTTSFASVLAPTSITVVATGDGSMVTVTWTAPAQYASFRVERKQSGSSSSSGSFATVASSVEATSFNDTNVASGTAYTYRVLTRLDSNLSDPSEEKTVVVP